MIEPKAWRVMGNTFETLLIGISLWLLYANPLHFTAGTSVGLLLGVPLLVAAIVFPVTLPSMLISLELVYTFYFVLAGDFSTVLWVNFIGELFGTLMQIRGNRKVFLLLNPAIKVVCLALGFAAFRPLSDLLLQSEFAIAMPVLKLVVVGVVFFLFNHIVLNLAMFLNTSHFTWKVCLSAIKWESLIYLVVFPLAFLGNLMHPYAGDYSLLILAVPVAILTSLLRGYNRLLWSNRVNQECLAFSTTDNLSSIYERAFQMARDMTDSPRGLLLKKDDEGNFYGVDAEGRTYPHLKHPLLNRAITTQEVQVFTHREIAENILPFWEVGSLALVPLVGKSESFGIICLGKVASHGYKQGHLSQLRYLGNQVSIILDRNHAYEQLAQAAITNKLTGLYNYQYFYEQLDERFHTAKAMGNDLTLILFDIDYFKKYNDIYGHIVGDQVLKQVAKIAKQVTDKYGLLLARYGGEEFSAIGDVTIEQAYEAAEEIRQRMEEHQFSYQEHTVKNITISVGISHVEEHDAITPSDLLEKADQALYWGAKEMGRNRIAVYGSEYDQRLFIDSLTGLHTIYYLRRKLRSMCEHASRFPMHFLLVDIRGMRKINEKHGFEVGNQILIDASYLLKNTMRADDQIVRYVDDEFLVIVQGIPEEDIGPVCERIQDKFSRHLFPLVGSTVRCDVTVVTMHEAEEQDHVLEWLNAARRRHKDNSELVVGGQ
ncbi:MAG: sensor domain-containing diguanylate cyclase [Tumebacillaceae bacterium]